MDSHYLSGAKITTAYCKILQNWHMKLNSSMTLTIMEYNRHVTSAIPRSNIIFFYKFIFGQRIIIINY